MQRILGFKDSSSPRSDRFRRGGRESEFDVAKRARRGWLRAAEGDGFRAVAVVHAAVEREAGRLPAGQRGRNDRF
jgi:hypothetical protein